MSDLDIALICAKCGCALSIDPEKSRHTSADTFTKNISVSVVPCSQCVRKAQILIDQLENFVRSVKTNKKGRKHNAA